MGDGNFLKGNRESFLTEITAKGLIQRRVLPVLASLARGGEYNKLWDCLKLVAIFFNNLVFYYLCLTRIAVNFSPDIFILMLHK